MLTHPTHDRLLALGLTGIAKALEEQRRSTAFNDLSFEERLGCLLIGKPQNVTARNWPRGSSSQLCARLPASKIWICAHPVAWTAASWPILRMAVGSPVMRTC